MLGSGLSMLHCDVLFLKNTTVNVKFNTVFQF